MSASTTDEQISWAKTKIAENIAARIEEGATYEEAAWAAFQHFNRQWPKVLAAVLRSALDEHEFACAFSEDDETASHDGSVITPSYYKATAGRNERGL